MKRADVCRPLSTNATSAVAHHTRHQCERSGADGSPVLHVCYGPSKVILLVTCMHFPQSTHANQRSLLLSQTVSPTVMTTVSVLPTDGHAPNSRLLLLFFSFEQTIARSEEHGIVPALDAETHDSVRPRRRHYAQPGVSKRRHATSFDAFIRGEERCACRAHASLPITS